MKQQQMKKPRKKKRKGGGDKSLDFFGISSANTSATTAAAAPPSGDPSWHAPTPTLVPDGAPPLNNLSSVFFDPVGMFTSEADKVATAEAAGHHGYGGNGSRCDSQFSSSSSGRFNQRVGATAAGFDLGFAGKMFSFFDDDGDAGGDDADPILQQVARNKSDPSAVNKQRGKVQMLLQTYNFSFDEGGGYMDVADGDGDGDGAADGASSSSKPKTDEENQLESLNIGHSRGDEDAFDIAARVARHSVVAAAAFLRALLVHAKSLFECLEIATHGFRTNASASASSSAPLLASSSAWDTPPLRAHALPRAPFFGGGASNPLRACVGYIEFLVNPEVDFSFNP